MTSAANPAETANASVDPVGEFYAYCRAHVLARIAETHPGDEPFRHLFIDEIFPEILYNQIREHMLDCKYNGKIQDREQDNPAFINKRFNLFGDSNRMSLIIKSIFSENIVKKALVEKFYSDLSDGWYDILNIHKEFEYFFTKANLFQNIHVDIPPKFLSFVFYIPENPLPLEEEGNNATILYDKKLDPHYKARFRSNSLCVFAPHFYSYHGFASTMDRDVLVMFYVHPEELAAWRELRSAGPERPPYSDIRDAIERKLKLFPLIEYDSAQQIQVERAACLVNAPQGRVLREGNTNLRHIPS